MDVLINLLMTKWFTEWLVDNYADYWLLLCYLSNRLCKL